MRYSFVAVAAMLFPLAAFGQEFRATVSGLVTDATGAAVAGAKITATEVRTGTKTQTVSEPTGQYTIPFLAPGQYQIAAQMQGFKEFIRRDINLGSGDHPVIDIRLDVGDTTQSVEVSADAPLLNTDNASTGQAITTKQVEDIPLNGGTPLMVAQYALGVIATGTPTLVHPFDLGGPSAFSIAGTPSQTSELLVDGVPDATWDGRVAYNPPRDAVQEVRVKAFDADASFGHTGGGTMNQVLKSGTNELHGSAWEYNQPSNMVANDFFRNRAGQGLQVTHFNQFGVTAGGPVVLPKYNGPTSCSGFSRMKG